MGASNKDTIGRLIAVVLATLFVIAIGAVGDASTIRGIEPLATDPASLARLPGFGARQSAGPDFAQPVEIAQEPELRLMLGRNAWRSRASAPAIGVSLHEGQGVLGTLGADETVASQR